MEPHVLEKWRDHLADSFSKGSEYATPFRFIKEDGSIPKLSLFAPGNLKPENVASTVEDGVIRRGRGRPRKVKPGAQKPELASVPNVTPIGANETPKSMPKHTELRPKPVPAQKHIEVKSAITVLQTNEMTTSTLPKSWRKPGFSTKQVCLLLLWYFTVLYFQYNTV
jgi:hypothetical protein